MNETVSTPGTGVPLLDVRGLQTSFATQRGALRAVDDVSFTLAKGETLGIVGESGSGKSVLARTVMNLLETGGSVHVKGEVYFEGRAIASLPRAERQHFWGPQIAMVFQDPMTSLNPVKRIGTHVTEPLRYHLGLGRRAARDRALELLQRVGIPEPRRRLDQYPHELSGGMRQRVVIAMALACEPKLLIADEPTTALDVTVQRQILDLLAALATDEGMATILISHDLGVVAGRTHRIAVMYAGRIVETAEPRELFARMRHPYTEALLGCVPRLDQPGHTRLTAISGRPPDLAQLPKGCRFAPRCRYAQSRCLDEDPVLTLLEEQSRHSYACHFPPDTPPGIAAREANERSGKTAAGLRLDALEAV